MVEGKREKIGKQFEVLFTARVGAWGVAVRDP